jgi:hypothetical protein
MSLIETASDVFLTTKQVCARYSRSQMTLWRWEQNPAIGFPRPMVVNGLKLYRLSGLLAFEARQVTNGANAEGRRKPKPVQASGWPSDQAKG